MEKNTQIKFWLSCLVPTALLVLLLAGVVSDLRVRYAPIMAAGTAFPRTLLLVSFYGLVFSVLVLLLTWRPALFNVPNRLRLRLGWTRWVLAVLVAAPVNWIYQYSRWSDVFGGTYLRILFYLGALGLMAWLVASQETHPFDWNGVLASGVLLGAVYVLEEELQGVVSYPFALSWSEGNRLWDYSVLYGRRLYDYPLEKPLSAYIDPGRQSLWGLPFLLPYVSILAVRLWSAFLFTIPYIFLGWFIFKPQPKQAGLWIFIGLWSMFYLYQGPIYTPLVLAAILVAAGWRRSLWLAVPLVMLAGYYATNSRSTWTFAPGIWAGLLAFVSNGYISKSRPALQRWVRTIVLGLSGLFGGVGIPVVVSQVSAWLTGNSAPGGSFYFAPSNVVSTVGRQPLIWSRLWPNETYNLGIVFGLLIAVAPLVVILLIFGTRRRWQLDILQKLAMWGVMLVFLGVGLVVSVKIGGGSNLHNMDMLLIGLLFIAGMAWDTGLGNWLLGEKSFTWWKGLLLLTLVFLPYIQSLLQASPRTQPPPEKWQNVLGVVRQAVLESRSKGEILFMDQRQLLTFGFVERVPLVAEYEKKYMMDEAMAEDANYFQPFIRDLAAHRFVLIISEPLWINYQGGIYEFGNENDAFVKWVSTPVLCYYQPVETFLDVGVQLLVPRDTLLKQEGVTCPVPSK